MGGLFALLIYEGGKKMSRKLRWGVLGYARIARMSVIPAILRARNAEFYAIASRDEEKIRQCREEFSCTKAYKSYDELLDDPDVEVVYIPLPNALHKEWTIKAILKGKHVLCEKPMALNSAEAEEMFETARKHKVKLMEAFMYRFTDRTRKVKEILDSGIIGEVKYINSTFQFFLSREDTIKLRSGLGGGSLYDVGCYPVNFIGMVTGRAPVSMTAQAVNQDGVDILFSALLKYDNGVIANINSGFNAFERVLSEIVGTKGALEIPDTFLGNEGGITLITADGRKDLSVDESDRYKLEVEHFSDAVINNSELLLSPEETIRNMKIIEELLKVISE